MSEGRNGPVEPNAEMRKAASNVRQVYVALLDEKFTEDQALRIVGELLRGQGGGQ